MKFVLVSAITVCTFFSAAQSSLSTGDSIEIGFGKAQTAIVELRMSFARDILGKDNVKHIERRKLSELSVIPDQMSGLISTIPGVYQASGGSGVSKPVIRGFQGRRIVTSWNGLRIENQQWGRDNGMAFGTLGVASMEVHKGPASLVFGPDALGGAVQFSDKPFIREGAQKLELQTGIESATSATISSLDYGISFKHFRLSASGSYSNYADYKLPNGNYVENSRFNEGAGRLTMAWARRRWLWKIRYMYVRNRVGVPNEFDVTTVNLPEELEVSEQLRKVSSSRQMIENHLFSLDYRWRVHRHTVKFLLGQTVNQLKKVGEESDIAFNATLANSLYHLKWQYEIGGGFNLASGVQGGIQFNRNGEVEDEFLVPDFNQMDHGIYSVLSSKFRTGIDTWKIQAGLRYDIRSLEAFETDVAGTFKRNYQSVNGSIGLDWSVGPLSLIGNISTGFRSPHVSELAANGAQYGTLRYEIGNPDLLSERATQFDGVLEISVEDHLEFVVNPFVNYVQNYIYANATDSVIDNLPVFEYGQLSEVFLYGMDVGLSYNPQFVNWLNWESTYSHIVGEGANGDDLPLMPQNRFTNTVKFQLQDLVKGKFRFENLTLRHSAFFAQNRVSHEETPSNFYHLIDLGLNMKLNTKQAFEFGAGVRNLLNEGYIDHLSRLKNIGVQQMGRNIYFQVKFTFYHRKKTPPMDTLLEAEEFEVIPL